MRDGRGEVPPNRLRTVVNSRSRYQPRTREQPFTLCRIWRGLCYARVVSDCSALLKTGGGSAAGLSLYWPRQPFRECLFSLSECPGIRLGRVRAGRWAIG